MIFTFIIFELFYKIFFLDIYCTLLRNLFLSFIVVIVLVAVPRDILFFLTHARNGGERIVDETTRSSAGKLIVRKLTSDAGARCTPGQFCRA